MSCGHRAAAWTCVLAALIGPACAAAQQLYRWTDESGRVHITDTPPPASAKDVQRKSAPAAPVPAEPQPSYELSQAERDFPVVLYTTFECKDPCDSARGALNRRGVPFLEVSVWDEQSREQLKRVAGAPGQVPVLVVGRSVQKGYSQASFDALLDAARYPRAGVLPPRAQAAPKPPPEYSAADAKPANADQNKSAAAENSRPTGPYAPRYSK